MPIDENSFIPKYYQLKEIILEYILENKIGEGSLLPSENELIKKYNVSRNTVREAFNTLEKDGIIYKIRGKGTFYRGNPEKDKVKSKLIGVITPVTSKSIYQDIIHGIEDYAHNHNYSIILSNSNANPVKEQEALEAMLEKNIDGLIIEPALSGNIKPNSYIFKKLSSIRIPVITIDCHIEGLNKPSLTLDDRNYGFTAANYLIDQNHKKIAFIFKNEVIAGRLRYEGFIKAHNDAGIPADPELAVSFLEAEERAGTIPPAKITEKLMKRGDPPTAIIYFNDEYAFQGIQTLRAMGLKIPEDVSVIGIDDSYFARISEVPLTTLAHPKWNMGTRAAEMILDEIRYPGKLKEKYGKIQPELIIRESVAPLE